MDTLAQLHQSIDLTDPELYSQVVDTIEEVSEVLSDFAQRISSSILIDRICESEDLKRIVLANVDGLFYIVKNVLSDDTKATLIDLMFSAVGTVEDEVLCWSLYTKCATPSNFIPLPFEYLTKNNGLLSRVFYEDFMEIFESSDEVLNSSWITQLGHIVRFKLIPEEQIIEIATLMSSHFGEETFENPNDLINFMCSAFFDELAQPNCPKETVNFLTSRPKVPCSRTFYESLWNQIVCKHHSKFPGNPDLLVSYISVVLQNLDSKYPKILESFNQNSSEEALVEDINDRMRFFDVMAKLQETDLDMETDKLTEFIDTEFTREFQKFSIKSIRPRVTFMFTNLLTVIEAIETSETEDPIKLRNLLGAIGRIFGSFLKVLRFVPEISTTQQIKLLVDLAFKLDDFYAASDVLELTLLKLKSDKETEYLDLLEIFFSQAADNLSHRPAFFPVKISRKKFTVLPVNVLSRFLESIKNFVVINEEFITFLGVAYMNDAVNQELLAFYMERIGSADSFIFKADCVAFYGFFSSVTNVSYLEYIQNNTPEYLQKKILDSQANSIKAFEVLTNLLDHVDAETRNQLEKGILPWMCTRMVTYETLRPQLQATNQFNGFNFNIKTKSPAENVNFLSQLIQKLIKSGASTTDLQKIYEFIRASEDHFKDVKALKYLNSATSFALLVLILRTDATIVPVSYISAVTQKMSINCILIPLFLFIGNGKV